MIARWGLTILVGILGFEGVAIVLTAFTREVPDPQQRIGPLLIGLVAICLCVLGIREVRKSYPGHSMQKTHPHS